MSVFVHLNCVSPHINHSNVFLEESIRFEVLCSVILFVALDFYQMPKPEPQQHYSYVFVKCCGKCMCVFYILTTLKVI